MIPGITAHMIHAAGATPPSIKYDYSNNGDNVSSVTVTISNTPVSGNLLLCFAVEGDQADTPTTPSGWTLGDTTNVANGTVSWFYKISAGNETSVVVDSGNPKGVMWAHVLEVENVDGTTPIDGSTSASGSGTTANATGLTTGEDNCLLIHHSGFFQSGAQSSTPPSGYTEQFDDGSSTAQNHAWHAASYDVKETAGATGTVSASWSGNNNWVAHLISIAP